MEEDDKEARRECYFLCHLVDQSWLIILIHRRSLQCGCIDHGNPQAVLRQSVLRIVIAVFDLIGDGGEVNWTERER